jgi:hypothetical protein
MGPNTVYISLPSLENRNISSLKKCCVFWYVEFWTMDKVHRPSNSEARTPSPDPSTFYLQYLCFKEFIISRSTGCMTDVVQLLHFCTFGFLTHVLWLNLAYSLHRPHHLFRSLNLMFSFTTISYYLCLNTGLWVGTLVHLMPIFA